VAIGGATGAVTDLAGVGHHAMHRMQILANLAALRNPQRAAFESAAEFDEDLFLQSRGEGAEFDFAAELLFEGIAEADAGAGVIEADFAGELDAGAECFDLGGGGGAAEDEDFAGEEGRFNRR
jgi:hypothetical protein